MIRYDSKLAKYVTTGRGGAKRGEKGTLAEEFLARARDEYSRAKAVADVKFKYVPAHKGWRGNEEADKLAEEGREAEGRTEVVREGAEWERGRE